MSNLSHNQLGHMTRVEDEIRSKGLMNPDRGFVGNGFWWGMYPTYVGAQSGFGQNESYGPSNAPVSSMGATASVYGPGGDGGMGIEGGGSY
jgi:hypothetical protein